jgi:uncharacterized membrane protein YdjX (TVP38/TMEM64 family)
MDGGHQPVAPLCVKAREPSIARAGGGAACVRRARRVIWIRIALPLCAGLALIAAWQVTPLRAWLDPQSLARAAEPLRDAWWGPLAALAAYVVLALVFFPLFALVLLTGSVFGPWLGSLYAMLGALTSGAVGFLLGRRLGRRTVERLIGMRGARFHDILRRNGVVAVFLARKVPFPYTLTNLVLGAFGVKLRDFLLGSLLGLGAFVALLPAVGHELVQERSSPGSIALAGGLVVVAAGIAWAINRRLKRVDRAREEP